MTPQKTRAAVCHHSSTSSVWHKPQQQTLQAQYTRPRPAAQIARDEARKHAALARQHAAWARAWHRLAGRLAEEGER